MKMFVYWLLVVVAIGTVHATDKSFVTLQEMEQITIPLVATVSDAHALVQDDWPGIDFEDRGLIAREPIEKNVTGVPKDVVVQYYGAFEMCAAQAILKFRNKKQAQKETWTEYVWHPHDSRVSFVNGTLDSGEEVFLFDTDNDEDFSDEQIVKAEDFAMGHDVGGVHGRNRVMFEYEDNGQIKTRSAVVDVYKFSQYVKTRKEPKFRGKVCEFLVGELEVNGQTFTIAVDNGGDFATYGTKVMHQLLVDLNGDGHLVNRRSSDECFPVNKPMNINGTTFEVVQVSPGGEALTLRVSDLVVEKKIELTTGVVAPAFAVNTLDGQKLSLADLKDKVVVLNFWAIGCGPCRVEKPGLNALAKEFDQDVVFIAPALDKAQALENYLDKTPFEYQVVADAKAWFDQYNINGMPTHIVIGRDGVIQKVEMGGGENSYDYLRPIIATAINK